MTACSIIATLQLTQPAQRKPVLSGFIRRLLADFIGLDGPEHIAPNQSFIELGTDSLQAVGFKAKLESLLACRLRTTLLFDHPRLDLLVDYLLDGVLPLEAGHTERLPQTPAEYEPQALAATATGQAVAIVGMAGLFPGADDAETLWQKALAGDCLQLPPDQTAGKFGYARIPGDESLAPAQRAEPLLSRLLKQALSESGLPASALNQGETGLFVAAPTFASTGACGHENSPAYSVPLANRLSFELDLKGPSETVNTFCTSVHVALHRAAQSLRNGECRQAVVAAVNLIDPAEFAAIAAGNGYDELLSHNNLTRSFGAAADGFVRSEGAGTVILKPLNLAQSDGDPILALIRGSAVHHGGRGYSLEAPNVQGLKRAIAACLAQAGCSSDGIDYVEAHGIGNPLADALELNAIHDAYQALSANPGKAWHIGSVKPSIGHPEVASGMASLLKAVKALQHRTLPGIAGLAELNPECPADGTLVLQSGPCDWPDSGTPRRAALNSYAIGGVNAHIVLEEYRGQTEQLSAAALAPVIESPKPVAKAESLSADQTAALDAACREALGLPLAKLAPDKTPVHYGFDSIRVVQFVGLLNERLGLALKVAQAMGAENFGEFFRLLAGQAPADNRPPSHALEPATQVPTEAQPLSETQKGLWFLQHSRPDSFNFNLPLLFRLPAAADGACLRLALATLLEQRPMLRSRFRQSADANGIEQIVGSTADNLRLEHLPLAAEADTETQLRGLLRRPFDLAEQAPLRLYTLEDPTGRRYYALFVIHHIVLDGLSAMLLANEFWRQYHALAAGENLETPAPDCAFFDFVAWERAYLAGAAAQQDLAYWKQQLAGHPASLALPYDTLPQPGLADLGMGCETLKLEGASLDALKYLGTLLNQNLSALLLGVFDLLLYRLSGEDDIAVNMPVAGRPLQRHRDSIGCYINLMIVRSQIRPEDNFMQLAKQIGSQLAQGLDHANYPFAKLMPALGLTLQDAGDAPFSVSFTYQNIFDDILGGKQRLGPAELSFELYQETLDSYMLEVYDFRDSLELHLKYPRNLFRADSIRRHLGYLENLIAQVIEDPGLRLDEYDCLPDHEQTQLLESFNATACDFPKQQTVYRLFQAQAGKTPDNLALAFAGQTLTYAELAERSRQLARTLQNQGAGPDRLVAVAMERSADMVVAVLAVLATGAAYLPLDPANAADRIRYMLADGEVELVLTQARLAPHLAEIAGRLNTGIHCRVLAVDATDWQKPATNGDELADSASPERPAYVIYTSGSTGQPKGVVVSQRSLLNLCQAMQDTYRIAPQDRILQFASLSFDMSVEEIFPYLLAGAGVVVRQQADVEADNFYRAVMDDGVTILNIPPQFYAVIAALEPARQQALFGQLRLIAFGGEALPEATLKAVQNKGPAIFNAYGPTEYTVNAAIAELSDAQTLSIGRPIANTRLYVLGPQLQLQPIGVAGELHIAGEGLALGYLNNPQLTAEKFIANPYGSGKLYKTGDRARWLADGSIAFLGRTDQQVKIRGYRVELGEIENALSELPGVAATAVLLLPAQAGGERLVAFYSTTPGQAEPDADGLREQLRQSLPDYMLPALFCRLDSLPLTRNGKIDRKALAQQPLAEAAANRHFAAPQSPLEWQLAGIWEQLLNYRPVGLDDDFFDLGGHSLLAIQLVHAVNRQIAGAGIGLADLRRHASVRQLAERLSSNSAAPAASPTAPASSPYLAALRDSIPSFIVPGMPGLSDGYHQLAARIAGNGPVYGLHMQGYAGSPPASTVEAMAAHNIGLIKALRPQGSIKLYAHSYGGTVAYEMLHQLQGSGIEIAELVLIDSVKAVWPQPLNAESVAAFLDMILANAGLDPAGQRPAVAAILAERPYATWAEELAQLLQQTLGLAPDYFHKLWRVVETSLAVDYRYPHGKLPYRPTLVIAEESRSRLRPDSWQDCYEGVDVRYAAGGHYSLVAEPYCGQWLAGL